MDCYILLVSDTQDLNVLVSTTCLAKTGDLVMFADGNIGEVQAVSFFNAEQYSVITGAEDVFPAEMLYSPTPLFHGGDDEQ